MDFDTIKYIIVGTASEAIQFLRENALLLLSDKCDSCGNLFKESNTKRNNDSVSWRCLQKNCENYRKYFSIRRKSFFEKFKISLNKCIHLIHLWAMDRSQKSAIEDTGVSQTVIVHFYAEMRNQCKIFFTKYPIVLGGQQRIVQIDESLFRYKPKYHRGRAPENELWVFGMVDDSNNANIFLQLVENRTAATLLPIIRATVQKGSIIMSDEWKAYTKLANNENYIHLTVNHKLLFIDRDSGANTQRMESIWGKLKIKIVGMKGVYGTVLQSYLYEWVWRQNIQRKNSQAIISLINV